MKVDRTALARFAQLRLHAPSVATSLQQGDRRSPFLGRGVEFADFREYDPGDDIRLIDWNVYLRLGQVLVRQFNEERSLSIKICLDVSASSRCASAAASLFLIRSSSIARSSSALFRARSSTLSATGTSGRGSGPCAGLR